MAKHIRNFLLLSAASVFAVVGAIRSVWLGTTHIGEGPGGMGGAVVSESVYRRNHYTVAGILVIVGIGLAIEARKAFKNPGAGR